ncbi:LOW QUALITY PROTEIN: NADH dehydrogenase [ubiquinone] 1 alpha subcomplex assembly factor 2 [Sphaerodactylus townsendi]|uniref:LOW QUALITY PROTEIN: NADH dehydrogenase [ubiquinone] 1 alpha subcomplex assembly factor 2 n=1 Tax=Sphaerodactylus townsendi TaxID=933632 RepID=UPI00202766E6|nr:LOW QUALITY PROTEIN: NADH dehydrogenase [ubiquinone] 1 alpha subcomplex assembly factor 2 [Sphaerodactylus townsendi]
MGGAEGVAFALKASPGGWRSLCSSAGGMNRIWRLMRALQVRVAGPEKQHVGVDLHGNKYYRIPKHETWAGHIVQERRFMEPLDIKEHEYEAGDMPTEWEAWIRKKRKDPPTFEEILNNEKFREDKERKVEDRHERDCGNSCIPKSTKRELGGRVSSEPEQRASFCSSVAGRNELSEDPVSTANTFQPGSWKPAQDQEPKK